MKRILPVLFIFALTQVLAEAPAKILTKTKELKSIAWYTEQAQRWRAQVDMERTSGEAWLNYYAASRYARLSPDLLSEIVDQMSGAVSDSFEFYLIRGWHNGFSAQAYQDILKAYQLNPGHPEVFGLLTLHSEFRLDDEKREDFGRKMFESGQLSASLLSYSYNVLMSVEPGAILFTEGENTTLPLFLLQDLWKVRQDVVVLNLEMLNERTYRNSKLAKENLVISPANSVVADSKWLCADLPVQNPGRKFYYALTLSRENIESLKDQLYVVGLASQLSPARIDNLTLIKENMEKRFLLDYLSVDFNGSSQFDTGRVLSANYLVPLLLLYEHYGANGETSKQKETADLVYRVAATSNKQDIVDNLLRRDRLNEIPFFPGGLNTKALEGKFRKISPKIWAEEAELTNEKYNDFLAYLVKNNLNDLYEKFKFDLSAYEEPALSMMKGYSSARPAIKKEKYFTQHPAVNISYEGAVAYCTWLTDQYNHASEKKYKRVLFRLPTVNEFQIAAAGIKDPTSWNLAEQTASVKIFPAGKEFGKDYEVKKISVGDQDIQYPWFRVYNFRNSPKNQKGCYLGNFKVPDNETPCMPNKMTSADGFLAMGPVESYFPNDIGLYDVVGNVAEMTSEKGKACGGSWNHVPQESTIKSVNLYDGPNSAVGFRVFMEIVEQ